MILINLRIGNKTAANRDILTRQKNRVRAWIVNRKGENSKREWLKDNNDRGPEQGAKTLLNNNIKNKGNYNKSTLTRLPSEIPFNRRINYTVGLDANCF